MIKIAFSELSKHHFQGALRKLANVPMRSPEAFKIKHILKHLESTNAAMSEAFKKDILAVYAEGGENGSQLPKPKSESEKLGLPFNALVGKEQEAKDALDSFGKRECTIPHTKLTGQFLLSVAEWTPAELIALDPILADLVEAV